jgi:hypothetical protein
VGDYMQKYESFDGQNLTGPKKAVSQVHLLPAEEPNFKWRVRVDLRCALDAPLNRTTQNGLPSCYAEFGWSLYEHTDPDEFNKIMSVLVENTRHPHWNQQLLFHNPPEIQDLNGYFWLIFKDRNQIEPFEKFNIPLYAFKDYQPVHLELECRNPDAEQKCKIYLSLTLERPMASAVDSLCQVVTNWANFNPLPGNCKKFSVVGTTDSFQPEGIPFLKLDLSQEDSVAKVFSFAHQQPFSVFASPWMRIPPDVMDNQFGAIASFAMPKSFLDRRLKFFMLVKDETKATAHAMPDEICGFTDFLDDQMKQILYSAGHERQVFPITYDPQSKAYEAIKDSATQLEISCHPVTSLMDYDKRPGTAGSQISKDLNKLIDAGPEAVEDRDKWLLLTKELEQKRVIIQRMMSEVDDKTASLKLTTSEIVDARRTIKMLQSENAILRKKMGNEEQIELAGLVAKEISKMTNEELKGKIIKLAEAYRAERLRNEEFERALKSANVDLAHAKKMQTELENLQHAYNDSSRKLSELHKELQKTNLYKDTIRKQEKVIAKLEALLEKTLKDTQRARDGMLELEKLRTENLELQNALRSSAMNPMDNDEVDKLRREVAMLESLVAELREELKNKRPQSAGAHDWEDEKIDFEVRLQKAQARVDAMQTEMNMTASNFAREITRLKMIIAEKESLIDTMSGDVVNRMM